MHRRRICLRQIFLLCQTPTWTPAAIGFVNVPLTNAYTDIGGDWPCQCAFVKRLHILYEGHTGAGFAEWQISRFDSPLRGFFCLSLLSMQANTGLVKQPIPLYFLPKNFNQNQSVERMRFSSSFEVIPQALILSPRLKNNTVGTALTP